MSAVGTELFLNDVTIQVDCAHWGAFAVRGRVAVNAGTCLLLRPLWILTCQHSSDAAMGSAEATGDSFAFGTAAGGAADTQGSSTRGARLVCSVAVGLCCALMGGDCSRLPSVPQLAESRKALPRPLTPPFSAQHPFELRVPDGRRHMDQVTCCAELRTALRVERRWRAILELSVRELETCSYQSEIDYGIHLDWRPGDALGLAGRFSVAGGWRFSEYNVPERLLVQVNDVQVNVWELAMLFDQLHAEGVAEVALAPDAEE